MNTKTGETKELLRLRARVAELEVRLAGAASAAAGTELSVPLARSPLPGIAWDDEFRVLEWNAAAEALFGYSRAEAIGRTAEELIIPHAARPEVRQVVEELLAQRGGVYSTNLNCTKDGRTIICQWFNTPLRDAAGRLIAVASLAHDITEQKQTEQELILSESRWRSLVENAPEIIITTDLQRRIQFVNRIQHGYPPEAVLGAALEDFVTEGQQWIVCEAVERMIATRLPQKYEVQERSSERWYSATVGPIFHNQEVAGVMLLCQETTARKQSERALQQSNDELSQRVAARTQELNRVIEQLRSDIAVREQLEQDLRDSEERFRAIATAVPTPMAIAQISDGVILYANQRLCELVQTPADQLLGHSALDFYVDLHDRQSLMQRVLEEGAVSDRRLRLRRSDGEVIWVSMSMRRVTYEGKDAVITSFLDITERHQAEQSLRHERRLLQRLLELQERDRQLIAYEIHDGFVQDVVGGKMLVEAILARDGHRSEIDQRELAQALQFLTLAINEGRRMIGELRPMIIDEEGIVAAIMYLIHGETERGGPEIVFSHRVEFDRLDPMLEGAVFRIVQEALNNAIRHSSSDDIEVRLTQVEKELQVEVQDQGIGFNLADVPEDRFGLRGIQERARLFGGRATIHTAPGKGTRVHAVLPLAVAEGS